MYVYLGTGFEMLLSTPSQTHETNLKMHLKMDSRYQKAQTN